MPPKRYDRRIDRAPPVSFGVGAGGDDGPPTDDIVPPAPHVPGAPQNLALTTGVGYSSAAPTAYIAATWTPPEDATGGLPANYQIQVSTAVTFTASGTITATTTTASAYIESLLPGTLYYVRVRAFSGGIYGDWTSMSPLTTGVNRITTATDTVAAGVPTSISAVWVGIGDLLVTWVNPTEANLKDVQVVVRASSGGTIYRTTYSAAPRFLYTYSMNLTDTALAGDSSLYVELRSRTFSNILGTTVNTGLITKSAPALPTGFTQSWSGDTGTAGPDLTLSWTDQQDRYYYNLTLDGVARRVWGNTYTFSLDANRAQHSGTPDPAIAYSLTASDGFHQTSTAVSGTATNAAPPTPTVTLLAGMTTLKATVAGTKAADFLVYEFVFKRDATTVRTLESASQEQDYELSAAADEGFHSWTVVVRQRDVFGQYSSTVTSSAVAFESFTLAGLRAGIRYIDSLGTAPATLKTAMADGNTTSGGVSYPA